jgi:hypothetical protein
MIITTNNQALLSIDKKKTLKSATKDIIWTAKRRIFLKSNYLCRIKNKMITLVNVNQYNAHIVLLLLI